MYDEWACKLTGIITMYYNENKSLIEVDPVDVKKATFIFPEGVESIVARVFYSLKSLKRIIIPYTVKTIGLEAFRACKQLEKVEFLHEDHPIAFCEGVFMDCTKLSSINLPRQLESIPSLLFFNCTKLFHLVIPTNVKAIGELAFCRSGLIRIDLSENIDAIEEDAFDECPNLRFIVIDTNDRVKFERVKEALPEALRNFACTKKFADENFDPIPDSNFCFHAFVALAALGGIALCISALFVASFPVSLALSLAGGGIALGSGMSFFHHHDKAAADGVHHLPPHYAPVR